MQIASLNSLVKGKRKSKMVCQVRVVRNTPNHDRQEHQCTHRQCQSRRPETLEYRCHHQFLIRRLGNSAPMNSQPISVKRAAYVTRFGSRNSRVIYAASFGSATIIAPA